MVLMIAAASRELKDFEDFFFVLDRVVLEAEVKSALRVRQRGEGGGRCKGMMRGEEQTVRGN